MDDLGQGATGAMPDGSEAGSSGKDPHARRARRQGTGRRRRASAADLGDKFIAGVPARIMRPRLVFAACLAALLGFGLVMVYSASSVEAISEGESSTYYLSHQAGLVALGLAVFAVLCVRDLFGVKTWPLFRSGIIWAFWGLCVVLLALVPFIGSESGGATRWILVGSLSLQPSELAKPAIILVVASLLADYYEDRSRDTGSFLLMLVFAVGLPLVLIVIEPDAGTTIIIAFTVFAMLFLAGISYRLVARLVALAAAAVALLIIQKPYRLTRFLVAINPWSDPYGTGYQATLAIMAFASGGLFGRGIGNSTMKYNYLPEAYNDYIMAIIGEELGLVGTLVFLAVYIALIASALLIALRSPTLHGQLLASGCAVILGTQAFVNILGILSVIPMTGKPLPFISYGGSSMISSLMLAGLIFRVSLESNVASVHDLRREGFTVMSEQDVVSSHLGQSTAGMPHARRAGGRDRSDLNVVDGGVRDGGSPPRSRTSRQAPPRDPAPPGGYTRVDLSDVSPADRLRARGTDAANGHSSSYRRDQHD